MILPHRTKSSSGHGKHRRTLAIVGFLILAVGIGATEMRTGNATAPVSGVSHVAGSAGGLASSSIDETIPREQRVHSKIVECKIEGASGSIHGALKTNDDATTAPAPMAPARRVGKVGLKADRKLRLDVIRVPPFITWETSNTSMNGPVLRLFPLSMTFGRRAIPTGE